MKIKRYLLSKSCNTRRMEKKRKIEYIVITSSRYKGFSALKNRNIIEGIKYKDEEEFSCNYIIDNNGSILNIIPDTEVAICTHNVDFDNKSISIMLTINNDEEYSNEEIESLSKLIQKLIKKYEIKEENIVLEYDVNYSRKPLILVEEPIILYNLIYSEKISEPN